MLTPGELQLEHFLHFGDEAHTFSKGILGDVGIFRGSLMTPVLHSFYLPSAEWILNKAWEPGWPPFWSLKIVVGEVEAPIRASSPLLRQESFELASWPCGEHLATFGQLTGFMVERESESQQLPYLEPNIRYIASTPARPRVVGEWVTKGDTFRRTRVAAV